MLSKYLPISWKQRKEQSHAQCHVTHRIRIFDEISEHVKVAKSVDIAVPELAVLKSRTELNDIVKDEMLYLSDWSRFFISAPNRPKEAMICGRNAEAVITNHTVKARSPTRGRGPQVAEEEKFG